MTAVPPTVAGNNPDSGDLTSLGYKQELHRGLGPFASFASGFSFVSILTTVFQLFIIGFGFGGPAYIWTWPIVFVGQFCVCLCFAELSARYPIAGAIYQWSRRVSTDPLGWMAGWLMQIGYIISVAAIAIALQAVLPEVWSGFQLVGTDMSPTSEDGALNAIILGSICIALCIAIASFGVTKMAMITRIGVTIEIIGVVVVLVILFTHVVRGPAVVFETNGVEGDGSYIGPFLASMLMAAYVMYGFDSAAELSEETNDPRRTAPRAITRCMLVSAVGGGLMILGTLLAAPDILAPELSTQGIAYVLTHARRPVLGPGRARHRRHLDLLGGTGDLRVGHPRHVLDGPRRAAAVREGAGQGVAADPHADPARHRRRRALDRRPADQPRPDERVRDGHGDLGRRGLRRLPVRDDPAARPATAPEPGPRSRPGVLHARPLGAAGERRGGAVRGVHAGQHRVAAGGDLRPRRARLVLPVVGADLHGT